MIAIIGGGVIGLAIGWRLAAAGRRVTVFDERQAGSGASRASAGMLAPVGEAEPDEEALLDLALAGHRLWPAFAHELEVASGCAIDFWPCGSFHLALGRDETARLRFQHDFLRQLGLQADWLHASDARHHIPHLSPRVTAALHCPSDHQVDNRKLATALRLAFLSAGGELLENTAVTALDVSNGRVTGIHAGGQFHRAETVVLAAGAWSGSLEALPLAVRPPVRPIKGQMICVRMPMDAPLVQTILWREGRYLVPRRDGRLLIGATVEEQGFDTANTAGALFHLLDQAREMLPGIDDLPIEEIWSGFRPASRDDAPIFGLSRLPGLIYATGHYRHGILLTPITADGVASYLLRGEWPPAFAPFAVARFQIPPHRTMEASQ